MKIFSFRYLPIIFKVEMNNSSNPILRSKHFQRCNYSLFPLRSFTSKTLDKKLKECYRDLNLPLHSKQDEVRRAFLELAKKYHPDSGSPEANIERFVKIETAFRVLSKHNTGNSCSEEIENVVYDIRHTAPQHRQYLSYEGVGHGTPFQRQKQWTQARAQRAATNVMEHRMSKAVASEKTLMKKGQYKKHDIKTKYGFDRLVEDYIQESMSKGEFDNLSGKGKPLKEQNRNPYVDFTTHKLNEVLINNGFTPEWITMNKDIDHDIELLRKEIEKERSKLGPYPLTGDEETRWRRICETNMDIVKSINTKINTYNLIVPLINKQKFHVEYEKMCDEILKHGGSTLFEDTVSNDTNEQKVPAVYDNNEDIIGVLFKAISDLFSFNREKKKNVDN